MKADTRDTLAAPVTPVAEAAFILANVATVVVAGWAGVQVMYPALCLALALYLRWQAADRFLRFVLWVWFLSPFIRRLADFGTGSFDPVSPIMVAPYLASLPALIDALTCVRSLSTRRYLPFLLIFGGIAWGYGVGLLRAGPASSTFKMLEWAIPPLLAFFLAIRAPVLDQLERVLRRTFLYAGSIMGTYAILQFLVLPPWDAFWMAAAETYGYRDIRPMGFRVFGTVNSTHPFGSVMMAAGLIAIGASRGAAVISGIPALGALMLSWTRAAWGGWVVALIAMWTRLNPTDRSRLTRIGGPAILVLVLGLSVTPLGPRVAERLNTLSAVSDDFSLQARMRLYAIQTADALVQPVGRGIGSVGKAAKLSGEAVHLDSGFLTMLFELGWPGTLLYGAGLYLLLMRLFRASWDGRLFAAQAFGLVIGYLAMMAFANTLVAIKGLLLWVFIGTLLITPGRSAS